MDQSEQTNESPKMTSSETTHNAAPSETATKGSNPMNSKERATERANEVKDRLVQAGAEARKRFAGTKLGQRVEQTVSQLETKFPELKTNLQAKAEERLTAFAQSATEAGDLAKNVAKAQVDQVLLNLQHKGLDLSQSNELVQKIGKSVLRRADEVRERLEGSRMAPEWLRDLKLGDKIEGLSQKLAENFGKPDAHSDAHTATQDSATVHAAAAAFSENSNGDGNDNSNDDSDDASAAHTDRSTSAVEMHAEPEMPHGDVSDAVLHAVAGDEDFDALAKTAKPKAAKKVRPATKH